MVLQFTTREIVLIALFAALTAVGAFIRIPFLLVPLTMQTLMVILAGTLLGGRLAAMSQAVYLMVGLMGIPIFAYGGGPGYVLLPTFGYLLGFIPGAFVIGVLTQKRDPLTVPRLMISICAGLLVIYAMGILGLYLNINWIQSKQMSLATALKIGFLVFIPGDILKMVVAALIVVPARERVQALLHGEGNTHHT
jgi:biotin transport system substrate-specific component